MCNKSPGVLQVALDYIKVNFAWSIDNTLYYWYYFLFVIFGSAGIWFDFAFPAAGVERDLSLLKEVFSFSPLLTFSAPIMVAILAKQILIGFSGDHKGYPIKTLRTFCFLYFLVVALLFVVGYSSANGEISGYSVSAVALLLIFQFFYGAKDKDYEDVSLDVSGRNNSENKGDLNGGSYD